MLRANKPNLRTLTCGHAEMGWENDPLFLMTIPRHTTVAPQVSFWIHLTNVGIEAPNQSSERKHKLLKNKQRSAAELGPESYSSSRSAKHFRHFLHLVSCKTWRRGHGFPHLLSIYHVLNGVSLCHLAGVR